MFDTLNTLILANILLIGSNYAIQTYKLKSTVINNGCSFDWFKISRGARKGCERSCVLFVLCIELLAYLMRANNYIHRVQVEGDGIKFSQLAKNKFSFVSDESSIKALFGTCDKFTIVSCLKLNK